MAMWRNPKVHDYNHNGGVMIPSQLYFFLGSPPVPMPPRAREVEPKVVMEKKDDDKLLSIRKSDTHGLGVFADGDVSAGGTLLDINLHPEAGVVRSLVSGLLQAELGKSIPVIVDEKPAVLALKGSNQSP